VFINDDEGGLHHDYEVWLEKLAPHAPIYQYWHNRTGEDACPERRDRNAGANLKRQVMGRDAQRWWPSPTAGWISARGSGSFTGNLTGAGGSGRWSKSSGRRTAQSYHEHNGLRLWWAKARGRSVRQSGPG